METINNLVNLSYSNKSTICKSVLFFYLIIASNFTGNLFSGQLNYFIRRNRYAQHAIGYTMMLAIINNYAGITNVQHAIVYSTIAYLWFILTTKLDLEWNLVIVGAMVISMLYENKLIGREKESEKDETLDIKDKSQIKERNNKEKMIMIVPIVILTIIGAYIYFNKKVGQYGGHFSETKFFLESGKKHVV